MFDKAVRKDKSIIGTLVEIANEYATAVKIKYKKDVKKTALSFNAGPLVNFTRATITDEWLGEAFRVIPHTAHHTKFLMEIIFDNALTFNGGNARYYTSSSYTFHRA